MSEQQRITAWCKIRDGSAMVAEGYTELIQSYGPPEISACAEREPDLNMILWKDTTGPHGVYRLADREANKDRSEFKHLVAYLQVHNGKVTINGMFVWAMKDGNIGAKQSNRKA
jgi:hypothetical protein